MRYVVDCREQPSENNCTLTIAGEREEVLKAAVEHAISSHGHTDSEELRSGIESALKPEQRRGSRGGRPSSTPQITRAATSSNADSTTPNNGEA